MMPTMYLHPAAFSTPGLNVPDLLNRNMPRRGINQTLFYEDTAAGSLFRNGLLEDCANSFVVLTGEPDESLEYLLTMFLMFSEKELLRQFTK